MKVTEQGKLDQAWIGDVEGYRLADPIHGPLQMCLFATRAATRSSKTLSFFKNIPAGQALERQNNQLFSLSCQRTGNMRKMLIDLSFPDSDRLGDLSCAHIPFTQEFDNLLTNGLHVPPPVSLSASIYAFENFRFARQQNLNFNELTKMLPFALLAESWVNKRIRYF